MSSITLDDVTHRITKGTTPTTLKRQFTDSGIAFFKVESLTEDGFLIPEKLAFIDEETHQILKRSQIQADDILFSIAGAIGRTYIVKHSDLPANTNQALAIIRPDKSKVDVRFLYYYLKSADLQNFNLGRVVQTAQANVSLSVLGSTPLNLPPLPTQRKIAAVLSAYDDLIENNTRRVRVLEDMARALYREWFVEYRFPGHEQAEFVEDEQGRRPKEWERVTVGDVALVHRGRSYKKENLVEDGGMPFINLKCIERDGGFRMDGIKRYNGPLKPSQTVMPDDIVMGVTDMTQERRIVARAARIPRLAEPAAVSMDLVKIEPRADVAGSYLYGMFRFSDFANEVKLHANGANVLHLSPDRITTFEFALPPEGLRNHYGRLASDVYSSIDVLNLRNANLRRTRDLLLPRLVSGELDVSELEIAGVAAYDVEEEAVA